MSTTSHNPARINGRFASGVSGNPGGRKPIPPDVLEMCRAATPKAIQRLTEIVEKGADADAVRAAQVLLDRAWGKPHQPVNVDADVRIPVSVTFVAPAFPSKDRN